MTKTIHISHDINLPANAVTQTFGFIARRGAGKTYAATKLAEGMLDIGAQVVALDPVGVWWGLRLSADGKRPGYGIPVFGGIHGDIPLEPGAGALVADLVVDNGISVILDVSMFRKGDRKRFATDFAEQIFHRKKSKRSPIHIFCEEAQVFIPQRVMGDDARMVGAFEDLIKLGRNFGIGFTIISQRPQAVNKDALNQTEALFVLQTNGAQERKALREWVVDNGIDVDLLNALPSLPVGTAFLWSPQWLRLLKKIKIDKKKTFNASATPEVGDVENETKALAPVDLKAISEAMKGVVERQKANDPAALRQTIAGLQKQLQNIVEKAIVGPPVVLQPAKVQKIEVPILKDAQIKRLEATMKKWEANCDRLSRDGNEIFSALKKAQHVGAHNIVPTPKLKMFPTPEKNGYAIAVLHQTITRPGEMPPPTASYRFVPDGNGLSKCARAILNVLAQYHGPGRTKNQLAVLSGYSISSSTFANAMSELRTGHLMADRGDVYFITPEGIGIVGAVTPIPQGEELLSYWIGKLSRAEREMLRFLVNSRVEMSKQAISEATGYSIESSTFANALSKLRVLELATGRDPICANEQFWEKKI